LNAKIINFLRVRDIPDHVVVNRERGEGFSKNFEAIGLGNLKGDGRV
jgi:hypothetical protein